MTTALDAIEVLNRIHAADPTVLPKLIDYRVQCNDVLAEDPTVQVGRIKDDPNENYEVGFLGVINGIFGARESDTYGYITATYDTDHNLIGFIPTPDRETDS